MQKKTYIAPDGSTDSPAVLKAQIVETPTTIAYANKFGPKRTPRSLELRNEYIGELIGFICDMATQIPSIKNELDRIARVARDNLKNEISARELKAKILNDLRGLNNAELTNALDDKLSSDRGTLQPG